MKDEIKEILEEIKSYIEHEYLPPYCELAPRDCKLLLDYIINLQKENERLKENAIHNDKVVDKAKWNEMIYKSRNEKAIEYIERAEVSSIGTPYSFTERGKDLLNILQGEDKDE